MRYHASCSFGPHLPTEVSSDAATCFSAPDLASLSRWVPALPHVPLLQAMPPRDESFGVATCSSILDLTSLSMWAWALPRGPGLASPRGKLRCCHVPHGPSGLLTTRIKKALAASGMQLGSHVSKAWSRVTKAAAKACGHAATVQFNSATHAQLTTPRHRYSGDTTRHDGTIALTIFSIAG
jgi:hypothetical protein